MGWEVYLHKTHDERRNNRIVEDLGGIAHVDLQIGSPTAIRFRFGPFELNIAERSLRRANQAIALGAEPTTF